MRCPCDRPRGHRADCPSAGRRLRRGAVVGVMTDRLRLVPVEGCDDDLYEVVVPFPFTWRLRAASYQEAIEKAKLGPPEVEYSIGFPLPDSITAKRVTPVEEV